MADKTKVRFLQLYLAYGAHDIRLVRLISSKKSQKSNDADSGYVDLQTILSGVVNENTTTKRSKISSKQESESQPSKTSEQTPIIRPAPHHSPVDLARRYHSTISSLSTPAKVYAYLLNNRETDSSHLVTAVHRILTLRGLSKLQINLLGRKTNPTSPAQPTDANQDLEAAEKHPTSAKSTKDNPNPWKDPRFIFLLESISQDLDSLRAQDLTRLIGCLTNHPTARRLQVVQKLLLQVAEYVRSRSPRSDTSRLCRCSARTDCCSAPSRPSSEYTPSREETTRPRRRPSAAHSSSCSRWRRAR